MHGKQEEFTFADLFIILIRYVTKFTRKYYFILFLLFITSLSLIIANILPPDTDMYTHLVLGKAISHYGILHKDVISQASPPRAWTSSEWLFQIILYFFIKFFGFASFRIFIACIIIAQLLLLDILLRKVLSTNKFFSFILSALYALTAFYFFTARPQIFSMTFFLSELLLLLLYVLKNKNFLYLLLPITYLWANFHASVVFSPLLCIGYFMLSLGAFFIGKSSRKKELKNIKVLGIYAFLVTIVSILPPLGFAPYQEVFHILAKESTIDAHFIIEFQPLAATPAEFIIYSIIVGIPLLFLFLFTIKKKIYTQHFWTIPLIAFIFFGYSAQRDTYYGYACSTILAGYLLSGLSWDSIRNWTRTAIVVILTGAFLLVIFVMNERLKTVPPLFPQNAASYIQKLDIQGNMFNQFDYGGFLAYRLYPEHKVFIDGRTDVYACCELPDYYALTQKIYLPNNQYRNLLNQILNKYHISYVIIVVKNDSLGTKLSSVLLTDPNWDLIWWDDISEIFIKNDGKNSNLLKEFIAHTATPMEAAAYKNNGYQQAYNEYTYMSHLQDSSLTRNAMGTILNKEGKTDQAAIQFEKSIQLDNTYANAHFNLAQVYVTKGQYNNGIEQYKEALRLKPTEGIFYVQLWKAYESIGEKDNAFAIAKLGYDRAPTDQLRQLFTQLMQNTQ